MAKQFIMVNGSDAKKAMEILGLHRGHVPAMGEMVMDHNEVIHLNFVAPQMGAG